MKMRSGEDLQEKPPGCGKFHLHQFPSLADERGYIAENLEMQKL